MCPEYRPFDLEGVCNTDFEIDHYQPIYYVLESWLLRDAMGKYAEEVIGTAGSAKAAVHWTRSACRLALSTGEGLRVALAGAPLLLPRNYPPHALQHGIRRHRRWGECGDHANWHQPSARADPLVSRGRSAAFLASTAK